MEYLKVGLLGQLLVNLVLVHLAVLIEGLLVELMLSVEIVLPELVVVGHEFLLFLLPFTASICLLGLLTSLATPLR